MQLTILGMGTAVPGTAVNEAQGLRLAEALCRSTGEQMTWLATLYRHLGVRARYLVVGEDVLDDALLGTRKSGLDLEHCGPTTGRRMELYARYAGPLAVTAAR